MFIHNYTCGPYATQVYTISADNQAIVVIDAAPGSFEKLKTTLANKEVHLFLTHGHWDHMADAIRFKKELNAKIYAHKDDAFLYSESTFAKFFGLDRYDTITPDVYVSNNDVLTIGNLVLKLLQIPGHTPGQIAIYLKSAASVFVGDTLFYHSLGRTDLPGGNSEEITRSIREKLYTLPNETTVYPGHGITTSIGEEKKNNPFVKGI